MTNYTGVLCVIQAFPREQGRARGPPYLYYILVNLNL